MTQALNSAAPARPNSAEQIRAERIANLTDRSAKYDILKLQHARTVKLIEVAQEQRANHDQRLAQLTEMKIRSRNAPVPAPQNLKPEPVLDHWGRHTAGSDAKADLYRQYALQSKAVADSFDRKIDQRLDAAERPRGLHRSHNTPTLDRSSR